MTTVALIPSEVVESLKLNTDLLALIGRDVTLARRGSTNGGEYKGPCPRCGGDDRFIVQPNASPFPRWTCRQCISDGASLDWRDVIAYVMWREEVGFVEACQILDPGIELVEGEAQQGTTRARPSRVSKLLEPPGDTWQARARRFLGYAQTELWKDKAALNYLRKERGLSDETILFAALGYNPQEIRDDRRRWGLGGQGTMLIPAGWVLPCYVSGVLWWARVRRHTAEVERGLQKWYALEGSVCSGVVYGLDALGQIADVVICEAPLDALLLRQHIGTVADVIALGTATTWPRPETERALLGKRVLSVFDGDSAGDKARSDWGRIAQPLAPPAGDVTDSWKAGHDLAAWAVPRLGPKVPEARVKWARYYLEQLPDGSDDTTPEARLWLALYGELGVARGWNVQRNPEKSISGPRGEAQRNADICRPGPETPAQRLARWYGGTWTETSAPEDVAGWIKAGHQFYRRADGRLESVPK